MSSTVLDHPPGTRARGRVLTRRLALILPSAGLALVVCGAAVAVLAATPHGWLDWALLVPFAIVMSWECLIGWQLVLGFASWLAGRDGRSALERLAETLEPVATGRSRTAILIPIYEEDAAAVFRRVRVMLRSLDRLGPSSDIALHVLSDTRDLATAADEEAAAQALAAEMPGFALHYRRREANTGRKAGNVAEFLDRCGPDYDFAVVLDADSLMSGGAIRRLIRLMEDSPRVGLIQTVSYAAGRATLFARIQQFAVRLYAPLALRGLHFWQGPEGSYWGHNAILRVAPFSAHCRLPVLPGRPPFGGEILCHDVVEAALLLRAGWEVHLLPEFEETWEEIPTNALDLMGRERRWCQGNLQHGRVLAWPGLKAASRAHLAMGIVGYAVAPLWWLFLLGGALRVLLDPGADHYGLLAYGATEAGPGAALLLAAGATLLLLPRVLNLLRAFCDPVKRAQFGGGVRLAASAALEQLFWLLFGPVTSLITSGFVVRTLSGQSISWSQQCRDERAVPFGEAVRRLGGPMLCGVVLACAAGSAGGVYALWMAPAFLGLLLSPIVATVSSRLDLGLAAQRLGLFLTADDCNPAPELQELVDHARPARAAEAPFPPMQLPGRGGVDPVTQATGGSPAPARRAASGTRIAHAQGWPDQARP